MKRAIVRLAGKKFIPAFMVIATLVASAPAQAMTKPNDKIEIVSNENTASVKYTGSAEDALFFDVKVDNPKADRFTLTITGGDGVVLFTKDYNDASFSKRIKILKAGGTDRYNISIHSSNKDLENTFSIGTVSRTIDDVVVTKL